MPNLDLGHSVAHNGIEVKLVGLVSHNNLRAIRLDADALLSVMPAYGTTPPSHLGLEARSNGGGLGSAAVHGKLCGGRQQHTELLIPLKPPCLTPTL
jgi:hypothetical protein